MTSFKSLALVVLVGMFLLSISITATEEGRKNMLTKNYAKGQSWYAKANQKNRCYFDTHNELRVKICG